MHLSRTIVALLAGLATLSAPAIALTETDDPAGDPEQPAGHTLQEVVVAASRLEDRAFDAERSVDVITGEEVRDRAPRTVPEALRESTGVFVQQTNQGGGSPIVRGLVGPQILLLIDGVRLNNSVFRTGPLQYLNLIDPFQIERLEVVRGAGSVLYGSDALGATINAVLNAPADRSGQQGLGVNGRLAGRYGSAAREKSGHLSVDAGSGWFGAAGAFSYRDFDDLEGGRGVGTQPFSGYRQMNAGLKLAASIPRGFFEGGQVTLAWQSALMRDVGRAEALATKHKYDVYRNSHDLVYARFEAPLRPLATDLSLTLSYQRFTESKRTDRLDAANVDLLSQTEDEVGVHTLGIDGQFTTRILPGRLWLVWGTEYYQDAVSSDRTQRPAGGEWQPARLDPFPDGSAYRLAGVYATVNGELLSAAGPGGLRLFSGYRFQHMAGQAGARDDAPAVDYKNSAHVFMAGVQGRYEDRWTGALTWSQGFRAPNLQESVHIGDTGDWYNMANPDLGPERTQTIELMNRIDLGPIEGSLAGYLTLMTDTIKRVPATLDGEDHVGSLLVVRNENGGNGRIWGIEGDLKARLGAGFALFGGLTWTHATEYLDEAARAADPEHRAAVPLSKIPPLFGQAGVRWEGVAGHDLRVFAEAFAQFAGKQDRLSDLDKTDVRIPEGGTPAWVTINARGGLDWHGRLRLTLLLENLADRKYKYHVSGVWAPGTNAVLSAEGSF